MSLFRRILNLFSRSAVERKIDAELRSHVEMRTADNIAAGMAPEQARREALLKFGNPLLIKEKVAAVDVALSLDSLFRDVHYAGRRLRKSPAFAITVIATLAFGIGANTAIFILSMPYCYGHCPIRTPIVSLSCGKQMARIAARAHGLTLTANLKNGNAGAAASRNWPR